MDHLEQSERSKFRVNDQIQVLGQLDNGSSIQLLQRINYLKRKKLELTRRLNLLDQQIQEKEEKRDQDSSENDAVKSARNKLDKLNDIVLAHRLTGISVFSSEKGKVVICFDNSWNNHFCESDYVELTQKPDDTLSLGRHTLPCFIPVSELADKYLQEDAQKFVSLISDYLFAFVTRKEEVKVAKLLYEDSAEWFRMEATEPVNFVKIIIGKPEDSVRLRIELLYEDLIKILPSKVNFAVKMRENEVDEETFDRWKEQLELLPFAKVLNDIVQYLLSNKLINQTESDMDSTSE